MSSTDQLPSAAEVAAATSYLPAPPPVDRIRRRADRRQTEGRRRRASLAACAAVLVATAGGLALRGGGSEGASVVASSPLAQALAPYGGEVAFADAGQPITLTADGRECVSAICRSPSWLSMPQPQTSTVDGLIVWTNVPAAAVAVGVDASGDRAWQRPVERFAVFAVDPPTAWHRFTVVAFAADGSVLASEEFVAGRPTSTIRYRDEDGELITDTLP